jgi:protein-disulfide isomerase
MQRALRNPVWLAAVAVALGAILIAVSVVATRGSGSPAATASGGVAGIAEADTLLAGIPQHGLALGSPNAKLTIEEFADIQCPYCKKWALEQLPTVLPYVRSGKVRLVFRPMAFVGPDSVRGARSVAAASTHNRAWQLIDVLYRNQGQENTGWATQQLLDNAAVGVGLDPETIRAAAPGSAATSVLQGVEDEAAELNVRSTPTLVFKVKGQEPLPLDPNAAFDPATLSAAIDQALAS